jgi:ATP-dependent Lon protease
VIVQIPLKMTVQDTTKNRDDMAKKDKKQGFLPQKRKGGGGGKDDRDDVDSKGNIKGLIDYDYDSEDDDYITETSDDVTGSSHGKSPIAHRTRNSNKNKLVKKPSKKSKYSDTSSEEEEEDERESKLVKKLKDEKKRLLKKLKQKEEEEEEERYAKKRRLRKRVVESEEEDEEEEDDEYEEEEEEEEEEDGTVEEDEDEEEEDEEDMGRAGGITLSFGIDEASDRLIPKRHNMKKESDEVKKFVKLITTPTEEDTIDGQIDQFKALSNDQRSKLLNVLETRHKQPEAQQSLMFKLLTMNLPAEVQSLVLNKYNALQNLDPGTGEYFKNRNWLEKLTSLPLGLYKELPVKIADGSETCGAFMEKARRCLDDAIYGQNEAKLQILQFIGTKIANPDGRGLSLLLAGPPGIGKTSLIKNGVAKAIQWPFQFISLGGDSDASTYTGHQLVYESSHCGKIVNSLCSAKSMSMVLMFDEVDKISATPKGEEVQNLLVHLTDPVQNDEFEDKYLAGIPIDLSRVMFTFSANYLERLDKVLLDRMTVINLQGYNLKEKVSIAENYLLPAALKEVGLGEKVGFAKEVVTYVVENYANEEKGVRELKRCIEQITQKVNMLRMFNSKDLPFHIKDFSLPFVIKKEHIDLFLKKKPQTDPSIAHLYT